MGRTLTLSAAAVAILWAMGHSAQAAPRYFTDAGGPNTWDNSSTPNWSLTSGGPYNATWYSYENAYFEGVGDTVNVSGTVSANTIAFTVDGYTLSGGTINFGNPTVPGVTVDPGLTATINSPAWRRPTATPGSSRAPVP